jgi:hypothetical protein
MNSHNAEKLAIFNRMTPEQRDYDRFVARRIPFGASTTPETENGRRMRDAMNDRMNDERGCSCHIIAPCSWCAELTEEEADAYWNGGIVAVQKLRRERNYGIANAGN